MGQMCQKHTTTIQSAQEVLPSVTETIHIWKSQTIG